MQGRDIAQEEELSQENPGLPLEMWYYTFGFLTPSAARQVQATCHSFKSLLNEKLIKQIRERDYFQLPDSNFQLQINDFWTWENGTENRIAILTKGDVAFCNHKEGISEITVVDIHTGKTKALLSLRSDEDDFPIPFVEIKALPFNKVAVLNEHGQIFIWNIEDKTYIRIPRTSSYHKAAHFSQLLVTKEGNIFISDLRYIYVYAHTGELINTVKLQRSLPFNVILAVLPDDRLATRSSLDSSSIKATHIVDLDSGKIVRIESYVPLIGGTLLPSGELVRILPGGSALAFHRINNQGSPFCLTVGKDNERVVQIKATDNGNLLCFTRDIEKAGCYYAHVLTFPRLEQKAQVERADALIPTSPSTM